MLRARTVLIGLVSAICWGEPSFAQSTAQVICNPKSQFTNIRSGPTAKDTQIVDRLPNKAEIKILDWVKNPEGTHNWLKVQFKHSQSGVLNTGYVYHEIVSPTCGDSASATTASAAPTPPKLEPELEFTLRGHGSCVTSATFSSDGLRIVTASLDKTGKVWDAKTGTVLATLSGHDEPVDFADFSLDGSRIVTASWDKTSKVWDAKTGTALATLTGHGSGVATAAFSPDGSLIITASSDKTAKVWDAKTGSVLATLSGHGSDVRSATFSPDRTRIITTSLDKTTKLWDAKASTVLATLTGHVEGVSSAAFSRDGSRIVTSSYDKTAKLWDARAGSVLATLTGHGNSVLSAAFSPNGSRIITASSDGTAKIWDTGTSMVLAALSAHGGFTVSSAFFSPDGTRVVTASGDKTVKVWRIAPTAEERISLRERVSQAESVFRKQLEERKTAAAALECDKVKAIDDAIGADGLLEPCQFNRQLNMGSARELYLAAAKFDAAKERDKAKKLYQAIVDRFHNDDLALQAATRITAIADAERAEESQKAAAKTAADAAAAAAAAAARASEVQSRPPSIPGGRAAGTRVYLCAGKGDCCEAIIVTPGEGKSKVEFPRACFPGGLLNPVFYRERQQEWFDNNVFRNQPM